MSALTEKIEKEIIDWYNEENAEYQGEYDEKAEHLDSAIDEFTDSLDRKTGIPLPSGPAKLLEQHGGEDEGSDYWVVFSVNDDIFKVEGYYSSWEGVNWDSVKLIEVEPVQVLVTKYKKKKA